MSELHPGRGERMSTKMHTLTPDDSTTELGAKTHPPEDGQGNATEYVVNESILIRTQSPQDRLVKRRLRGVHLFMITINCVLGTGLYWRVGVILELGGPLAVLLSFLLLGQLAWAVMQCITEMLCIWPVPGALSVYVSDFVDEELGIAAGIAYWFTYSVLFAAVIATTAQEIHYWISSPGFDGGVLYLLVPIIMIFINIFGVELYGSIEVATGSIKIILYGIVVILMVVIGASGSSNQQAAQKVWNEPTDASDPSAAQNWAVAFFMCLSTATFAFVGVEVVAASALEARWPTPQEMTRQRSNKPSIIGRTVKFSAIWISVLATFAYIIGGILASINIPYDDCGLPRLSWLENRTLSENCPHGDTSSVFVLIAENYNPTERALAHVTNAFIVFTAVTCANTNLYVASRTLFGLTSRLEGGSQQKWYIRPLAWLGRTNRRKVPMRVLVFSALAFCWAPFLQLIYDPAKQTNPISVTLFMDILAEMGSVGVVIVWACNCWAFIRYYNSIYTFGDQLEAKKVPHVRRFDAAEWNDYPYRSHGQPLLAYLALFGCLFILIVSNGSVLWKNWDIVPFLFSYLIVILFLVIWVALKLLRWSNWALVDLSKATKVETKIRRLHERSFPG
ncbi:amino acid transporter [Xylariales sp. AK1849]|nr:amino acid transporter [Xylariales sp. AK1849]